MCWSMRGMRCRRGALTIRATLHDADYVRITFSDTGMGISAEDLKRVFESFYSTKGERGTGLGLAMCRQIVDAHRGTISLTSTPGEGTTVTIDLLRADAMP